MKCVRWPANVSHAMYGRNTNAATRESGQMSHSSMAAVKIMIKITISDAKIWCAIKNNGLQAQFKAICAANKYSMCARAGEFGFFQMLQNENASKA